MVSPVARALKSRLRAPARLMRSALRWQSGALANIDKPVPIYPPKAPPGLKVHLGAGEINLQGWINADARSFDHIHESTDSLQLNSFSERAISAIYMCHVLEHTSFEVSRNLLVALHRKLSTEGCIIISVPDFDSLVSIYTASGNDLESVKYALMGGQGYEYNFHRSVYNRSSLSKLLVECGYVDPTAWEPESEFGRDVGDWSSVSVKTSGKQLVPLSLNLKAWKTANGHRAG